MASRNPDFATLSMEALEAADKLVEHMDHGNCVVPGVCQIREDFRIKKAAALKAIRKAAKGGKRG